MSNQSTDAYGSSQPESASEAGSGAGGSGKTGGAGGAGRRHVYPATVERLIAEFSRLPGIGRRTAERLAFHILKAQAPAAMALARAIQDVKETVRHCSVCYNLTDEDPCAVCTDQGRDRGVVLVVEQPKDVIALEQTGMFRGLYHVLMGRISPLDGIGPSELTIPDLLARIDTPASNPGGIPVREVVLGLNPTVEGDGTALYLADQLKPRGIRITRLARGLPSGGQLEYANKAVLADAIQGRQSME
jgi:recombination protein RecR